MSATPLTDAEREKQKDSINHPDCCDFDFAEQLETKLTTANATIAQLTRQIDHERRTGAQYYTDYQTVMSKLAQARGENERMRYALKQEIADLDDDIIGLDIGRPSHGHLAARIRRSKNALSQPESPQPRKEVIPCKDDESKASPKPTSHEPTNALASNAPAPSSPTPGQTIPPIGAPGCTCFGGTTLNPSGGIFNPMRCGIHRNGMPEDWAAPKSATPGQGETPESEKAARSLEWWKTTFLETERKFLVDLMEAQNLERQRNAARQQTLMDTECIERITQRGRELELALASAQAEAQRLRDTLHVQGASLRAAFNIDRDQALVQHAYSITIAVQTMVEAMGMHAENQQRLQRGESIAYAEQAFTDLINRTGCHHNGVLGSFHGL